MAVSSITETRQYLTFQLDEEVFGIEVSHVREILEFKAVTRVPRTPDYMRGVINLRGSVLPVLDMRLKLGLPPTERTIETCIVVMEANLGEEIMVVGAMVDSVDEVFELEPGQIEPPPRVSSQLDTDFIKGMGKRDERFIILLDPDGIFSQEELMAVRTNVPEEDTEMAVNQ